MRSPDYYEFFSQPKINSGNKAMEHIPVELDSMDARRPLVLTSRDISESGLSKKLVKAFCESNVTIGALFDEIPGNAGSTLIDRLASLFKWQECDSIIAMGSESVMDVAKGVNIVVSEDCSIVEYLNGKDIKNHLKPSIQVPSVYISGYETSNMACIDRKIIKSDFLFPDVICIDNRMIRAKEKERVVNSAMAAFTYAIEASVVPVNNPMIDSYALASIQFIFDNLQKVIKKPGDKKGSLAIANAGVMAGIALSNSPDGIVSTLAQSLAASTNFPPGILMGIILPYALDYKLSKKQIIREDLLLALAGFDIASETPADQKAQKAVALIKELWQDLKGLMPGSLKELKIPEYQITKAIEDAVELKFDKNACTAILENAWAGRSI